MTRIETYQQTLEEAFPTAEPGATPLGNKILVQLRSPKRFSAGGIELPDESQDHERFVTAVGKIISLGPIAYRKRDTLEVWAEGVWAQPGDYVRVPKWGGDRWDVPVSDDPRGPKARFVIYNDYELISKITGDPLTFKDYV